MFVSRHLFSVVDSSSQVVPLTIAIHLAFIPSAENGK
jgi:hypothetical protein